MRPGIEPRSPGPFIGEHHDFLYNTRVSQKFCNVLTHANLQCIHHVIKEVQVMKDTSYGW